MYENIREENIKIMKECLVKRRCIDDILNNLVCPEDYVIDFEAITWRFGDMELYKEVYHENLNSIVKIYLVEGYDVACGCQMYNIKGKPYSHVEYNVFVSKDIIEDKDIFEFILEHELAHFDLAKLPKLKGDERNPIKEVYCDIKSLEILSGRIEIIEEIKNNLIETMKPKFKDPDEEFYLRVSSIEKFLKGEINSEMIYNELINEINFIK